MSHDTGLSSPSISNSCTVINFGVGSTLIAKRRLDTLCFVWFEDAASHIPRMAYRYVTNNESMHYLNDIYVGCTIRQNSLVACEFASLHLLPGYHLTAQSNKA
jgi:hypothetical protein